MSSGVFWIFRSSLESGIFAYFGSRGPVFARGYAAAGARPPELLAIEIYVACPLLMGACLEIVSTMFLIAKHWRGNVLACPFYNWLTYRGQAGSCPSIIFEMFSTTTTPRPREPRHDGENPTSVSGPEHLHASVRLGKLQGDGGADIFAGLDRDLAAVFTHDALHNHHAQAVPIFLGGVISLKDF